MSFKVSLGDHRYRRLESELRDEDDPTNLHYQQARTNNNKKYIIACAIFASLNSALLGYDIGVMSGAIIFMQEDLKITEVQVEVLVGILSIVSLLGSLGGGITADAIGRKWTMALAAIVFQMGAAIMALAPSFKVLMIGRLFAGIGIGFGVMIAPVYIAEISPSIARGSLTTFPEIFLNLGILLGYISNYAFSGFSANISWRIMLAVGIIPSVFIGVALFVIPESPRWLVMQDQVEEARTILLKTNENENEAERRLAVIRQAAGMANSEKAVWSEFLRPSPSLRQMLIAGLGIQCFQQMTGIDAAVYYSPTIFKEAGLRENGTLLAATVAVGFIKTSFILVAIFLIDRVGRKPLLYVSTIGMTACLLVLSLALSSMEHGEVTVVLVIFVVSGYVAFFSMGIGPISWLLPSEIFPLRLRAQAAALGAVGNRICSGLVAMSFLSVAHAITVAGTFFIFFVISVLSIIFVYEFVPETKGKSLEQIELLFQNVGEHKGEVQLRDVERLLPKE